MPGRRHRPLSAATRRTWLLRPLAGVGLACLAVVVTLAQSCAAQPESGDVAAKQPRVEYVGTYKWQETAPDFGGYSAVEIIEGGTRFYALSDRATLRWGKIDRDDQGRITALRTDGETRLKDSGGRDLKPGWVGDSEGIAVGRDGSIWISFEGLTRVARYDTPASNAQPLPRPHEFKKMQRNSSLEALAITDDGTLFTMPERSGNVTWPFPVWRFRNGAWDQPFSISRNGDWLTVAADIGPDGRFYLLERDFLGLLGFRSRVRRFDLTETGLINEQILLSTFPLQYDNLEGMAVWDDGQGIRITMVSDDNFMQLLRTELVEYRVTEGDK